jgi:molecular chaperone DnaK (HSP70)
MRGRLAIGVDLGTSYSCVACVQGGEVRVTKYESFDEELMRRR